MMMMMIKMIFVLSETNSGLWEKLYFLKKISQRPNRESKAKIEKV